MKSRYTLQRTMIVYFLLIGFASLLVGIEFIVETHGKEFQAQLLSNFDKFVKKEITEEEIFHPIDRLRKKAMLMIVIILCVMIIVLTMFIKNITEPLQHMIEVSKQLSRGDLTKSVVIRSNNELAELGNVINELSSNLQEITVLSKNLCDAHREFSEKTSQILDKNELSREDIDTILTDIKNLQSEVETLSEMIEYFSFYTVGEEKNDRS